MPTLEEQAIAYDTAEITAEIMETNPEGDLVELLIARLQTDNPEATEEDCRAAVLHHWMF
jgi:hypothetical protein